MKATECPGRQAEPLSPKIPAARRDEWSHGTNWSCSNLAALLQDDSCAHVLCLGVCAQQNVAVQCSSDNSRGDFQYSQQALAHRVCIQGLLKIWIPNISFSFTITHTKLCMYLQAHTVWIWIGSLWTLSEMDLQQTEHLDETSLRMLLSWAVLWPSINCLAVT